MKLLCHFAMVLFFQQLPDDLQVCILQVWFHDGRALLRAMSAMDIACTNRAHRPTLLALLANPYIALQPNAREAKGIVFVDLVGHMKWLMLRQVAAVHRLDIDMTNLAKHPLPKPITLPHITSLVCKCFHRSSAEPFLQEVLLACPNLTSIQGVDSGHLITVPADAPAADEQNAFPGILALYASCLEALDVCIKFSWHKRILDLQCCHGLRVLKISTGPETGIVPLLAACPNLTDLSLQNFALSNLKEFVLSVLQAGRSDGRAHLRRLTLSDNDDENADYETCFSEILSEGLWLDYLRMGWCAYSNTEGVGQKLELCCAHFMLPLEELSAIFRACSTVKHLFIERFRDADKVFDLLTSVLPDLDIRLSTVIMSIHAGPGEGYLLGAACFCPMLTELRVDCCQFAVDELQLLAAADCKMLEVLWLRARGDADDNEIPCVQIDAGLEALFAKCSRLKTVSLLGGVDISFRSLQAILDNRLQLAMLVISTLTPVSITYQDIQVFYHLAKQVHLLPVPVITWRTSKGGGLQDEG